jgi:hypothetical protein
VVLAYTSSRLTRRPRELEDLLVLAERHGIRFEYVRSPSFDLNSADGRQVARMLAASDAAESERNGERVARARAHKAVNGTYGGGRRPYGFEPDGVTRREPECQVIADVARALIRGDSLRGLARDLRDREVPTVTGRPWTAETLRTIMLRERNAARMVHRGVVVGPAPWRPIVPPDVHDQVVRLLTSPDRRTGPGAAPRWLLSGLALCGICGAPVEMTGGISRAGRYRCKRSAHLARAAAPVEELVVSVVLGWIARDAADLLTPPRPGIDVDGLRAERAAIEANMTAVGGAVALGELTLPAGRDATRRGRARIAEIESELSRAAGPDPVMGELVAAVDPRAVWERLDLETMRRVLRALVRVRLLPATRRGRGFDPASVEITPV